MKKILLIFSMLCLLPNSSFGATACELLNNASISYCKKDLNEAIKALSEFVIDYSEHPLCEEALLKIADLHVELKQFDKAKTYYQAILANAENLQPEVYFRFKCAKNSKKDFYNREFKCWFNLYTEKAGDLLFLSCIALSDISYEEGNCQKALDYLLQTYHINLPRRGGCGVGIAMDSNEMALNCYALAKEMNKNELAMEFLLKQSFEMKNDSILQVLKQELSAQYTKKELQEAFHASASTARLVSGESSKRGIDTYTIRFLNTDIELSTIEPYWVKEKDLSRRLYGSRFYTELIHEPIE